MRTPVGDRYVLEQMLKGGYNLGGEQSGHIILSDYATTGDGFVAALQVLAVVQKLRRPVSEVCHRFDPLPQILKNVRYRSGKPLDDADVKSAIDAGEKRLNGHGRLLDPPLRHRACHPRDGRGRRPHPGRGSGRQHRQRARPGRRRPELRMFGIVKSTVMLWRIMRGSHRSHIYWRWSAGPCGVVGPCPACNSRRKIR